MLAALVVGCADGSEAARLERARAMLAASDHAAAVVELKALLQDVPGSGAARLLLGRALLATGNAAGAETELTKALQTGQPPDDVLPALAQALMAQGKMQQLITQHGNARLGRDEAAATFLALLAEAHAIQGRRDTAQRLLADALKRQPDHAGARLLEIRFAAAGGDREGALRSLQGLVAAHPREANALLFRAELMEATGAPRPDVEVALRQVLAVAPDAADAHARLIRSRLQAGDLPGALEQHRAMAKALPRHAQTLYHEALLAQQQGQAAQAREVTQTLVRRLPEQPAVLVLAARSELAAGAPAQAEAMLVKALAAAPEADEVRLLLARAQLRAARPERALATLKPFGTRAKVPVEALLLEAQAWADQGDAAAAERALQRAARLEPDNPRVRLARLLSPGGRAQGESALAQLRQLAETPEVGADAALAEIGLHLSRNDTDGALQALTALAARQPTRAWPLDLRGRIEARRGDAAAARAAVDEALRREPGYFPAVASLVALDLREQQPPAAQRRLDAFIAAFPNHLQAKLARVQLQAGSAGAAAPAVATALQAVVKAHPLEALAHQALIDHALSAGDARQALAAAQAALALLPDHLGLLERLALAQELGGDGAQAMATWRRWAELQPARADASLRLAEQHLRLGQTEAARAAIRRALQIDPQSTAAQRAAFAMAVREKRFAEAMQSAQALQAQLPRQPLGWILQGDAEAAQSRWPAAQAAYQRALERAPASAEAAARLHGAYLAGDRVADADALEAAWHSRGGDGTVFNAALADAASARRDWPAAETRWRALQAERPDDPVALNNLAVALVRQHKPEALALAERAAALAPRSAAVLDTLAEALADAQQPAKALEWQRKAVALAPEAAELRLRLARLHLQLGQTQSAREELTRVVQRPGASPTRSEAERLLAEIRPLTSAVGEPIAAAAPAAGPSIARSSWRRGWWSPRTLAAVAAGVVGALGLLVIVAAALRAPMLRAERTIRIDRDPETVFAWLRDLRQWPAWAPLPAFAPGMLRTFVDAADGRAATSCRWTGPKAARDSGYLDTVQAVAPSRMIVEEHRAQPEAGLRVIAIQLAPAGPQATDVTVAVRGPAPFGRRVRACGLDPARPLRRRLRSGLALLKSAIESSVVVAADRAPSGAAGAASLDAVRPQAAATATAAEAPPAAAAPTAGLASAAAGLPGIGAETHAGVNAAATTADATVGPGSGSPPVTAPRASFPPELPTIGGTAAPSPGASPSDAARSTGARRRKRKKASTPAGAERFHRQRDPGGGATATPQQGSAAPTPVGDARRDDTAVGAPPAPSSNDPPFGRTPT